MTITIWLLTAISLVGAAVVNFWCKRKNGAVRTDRIWDEAQKRIDAMPTEKETYTRDEVKNALRDIRNIGSNG